MSIASELEREMLDLINQERRAAGLPDLKLEQRLNASAENHSQWMLAQDVFSHTGVGGSSSNDRMVAANFDFSGSWRSGENIGMQSIRGAAGYSDDVEDIHDRLMNSTGHRANILNTNYDYVGIGIEIGEYNGYTVVMITQNFASTGGQVVLDNGSPSLPPPPVDIPPVAPEMIWGTNGNDVIIASDVDENLRGLDGDDVLVASGGSDTLLGGNGDDKLRGGQGADRLDGGQGLDVADYRTAATAINVDMAAPSSNTGEARGDVYISIEGVTGSRHDDDLRGDSAADWLHGWPGDDRLEGRSGNDTLIGGSGNDTLEGGWGDDRLIGANGNDVLEGHEGDDRLIGGGGNDTLEGYAGTDRLFGNGGSDTFVFAPGMNLDVVVDFQNNIDILNFRAFNFNNASQLLSLGEARNADLFFDLSDDDSLIIRNATFAEVVNDFLI